MRFVPFGSLATLAVLLSRRCSVRAEALGRLSPFSLLSRAGESLRNAISERVFCASESRRWKAGEFSAPLFGGTLRLHSVVSAECTPTGRVEIHQSMCRRSESLVLKVCVAGWGVCGCCSVSLPAPSVSEWWFRRSPEEGSWSFEVCV